MPGPSCQPFSFVMGIWFDRRYQFNNADISFQPLIYILIIYILIFIIYIDFVLSSLPSYRRRTSTLFLLVEFWLFLICFVIFIYHHCYWVKLAAFTFISAYTWSSRAIRDAIIYDDRLRETLVWDISEIFSLRVASNTHILTPLDFKISIGHCVRSIFQSRVAIYDSLTCQFVVLCPILGFLVYFVWFESIITW